jgi:hypothetical protein
MIAYSPTVWAHEWFLHHSREWHQLQGTASSFTTGKQGRLNGLETASTTNSYQASTKKTAESFDVADASGRWSIQLCTQHNEGWQATPNEDRQSLAIR